MADKTAQTIYIEADPATVMDVIADIGSYPEWVKEYKETEVLETFADGNPKTARLVLDATVLSDTMVLEYEWAADRSWVRWWLVSSSLLRALDGAYRLAPAGTGTEVTYELSVDLMIPMIGLLKRNANEFLTGTGEAMGDPSIRPGVKVRLEGLGKRFRGEYVVTKADHVFGSGGYTTSLDVEREKEEEAPARGTPP